MIQDIQNYASDLFKEWLLKNKVHNGDLLILKKAFFDGITYGTEYKKKYSAEEYLQK